MKLSFYNHCNNGDVHVSRELVKYVMREVAPAGSSFRYYHRNSPRLTVDIPELEHRPLEDMPSVAEARNIRSFKFKDEVFLNTWYAASPIFPGMFCTLNTLVELFRANVQEWFPEHKNAWRVEDFFPQYSDGDWGKWFGARSPLEVKREKWCVLVSNGQPMSGQTNMPAGHFESALAPVFTAHPDVPFLLTDKSWVVDLPNVRYTRDLIGLPDDQCDLPEHAFLSSYCDLIIGRGSGPFSFSLTDENLRSPDMRFLCFTDDERVAKWVYMTDAVKAKMSWSCDYGVESMRALVERELRAMKGI